MAEDEPGASQGVESGRVYTVDDLYVLDLDAWQTRFWTRQFGVFRPRHFCERIAEVAAECGATLTEVHVNGDWWTVVGDHDWIQTSPDDDSRLLEQGWPVPGIVNSIRWEFFLRAFARHAVVSRGNEITVLKGDAGGCPLLDASVTSLWRRGVSFVPATSAAPEIFDE